MRFTANEEVIIAQFCEDNERILSGNCNRPDAQKLKKEKWEECARKLNAANQLFQRTGEEVRKKWKNMKAKAKEKHVSRKRSMMETGGGPPPQIELTAAEEVIVTHLGDTPQFSGIPGRIESGMHLEKDK